jgi:hypothetical protein
MQRIDIPQEIADLAEEDEYETANDYVAGVLALNPGEWHEIWWPATEFRAATTDADYDVVRSKDGEIEPCLPFEELGDVELVVMGARV